MLDAKLSRLIYGARTSVFISLAALGTAAFVGTMVGLIAGFRGGWADAAPGFPTMLVALIIVGLLEASLSFLGLGMAPGDPSWGIMVAEGRTVILDVWWRALLPGLAITAVVLAFNFFGDWLRDTLDPKLRRV